MNFLDTECATLLSQLFAEELLPVSVKAQKKVPVPDGYLSTFLHHLLVSQLPAVVVYLKQAELIVNGSFL